MSFLQAGDSGLSWQYMGQPGYAWCFLQYMGQPGFMGLVTQLALARSAALLSFRDLVLLTLFLQAWDIGLASQYWGQPGYA